jgi:hypothetical protein
MWECRNNQCSNFGNWCWVLQSTFEHLAIQPADSKSWANKCIEGSSTIAVPPLNLIDYWRSKAGGGNQLNKKKDNRKRSSRDRRQSSSSGYSSGLDKEFWRERRRREKRQAKEQAIEREQEYEDCMEDRRQQRLNRQAPFLQLNMGFYG